MTKFKEELSVVDMYQAFTPTTAIYAKETEDMYLLLGLGAEVGELLDIYAKEYRDNEFFGETNKRKELGDILWFCSQICNMENWNMEEVMLENMEKLRDRQERNVLGGSGDDR